MTENEATTQEAYQTVAEYRHQAQAHAAELSQAVGDPLKAVRQALKVGSDIRTQTVEISYMLRGNRPYSQAEQVARLQAVLEKIDAIEIVSAEGLKEIAKGALEAALANLDQLTSAGADSAQAHLDALRDQVTKGLRLAQTRDFDLHQSRKHATSYGSHAPSWYDPDVSGGTNHGSGLEDGPIKSDVQDEVLDEDGD